MPHSAEGCPFVEHGDHRCDSHFSLGRISEAFGDCFGDYRQCSQFQQLLTGSPNPVIAVTVHGRTLQPTGT